MIKRYEEQLDALADRYYAAKDAGATPQQLAELDYEYSQVLRWLMDYSRRRFRRQLATLACATIVVLVATAVQTQSQGFNPGPLLVIVTLFGVGAGLYCKALREQAEIEASQDRRLAELGKGGEARGNR